MFVVALNALLDWCIDYIKLGDRMINLMQGDCLERMKEIKSGAIDMILTDPPYELSKSKGGGMMGSGGRKFIGIELDENYFSIAKERIGLYS